MKEQHFKTMRGTLCLLNFLMSAIFFVVPSSTYSAVIFPARYVKIVQQVLKNKRRREKHILGLMFQMLAAKCLFHVTFWTTAACIMAVYNSSKIRILVINVLRHFIHARQKLLMLCVCFIPNFYMRCFNIVSALYQS